MSKRRHTLPAYRKREPCGCARVVVVTLGGSPGDGLEPLAEGEKGFGKCEEHRKSKTEKSA